LVSALPKGARPKYLPTSPGDPADPYIIAEATALNNNPNQIFAFVRDRIAFEAYTGSVRGARGTLWALAGNTLDKASLLVALLGAAGYTAQYEHANIYGTNAQNNLILSMFPQTTTFVGCVPPGALTDNPVYNSAANQGSVDYYWVQYGTNGNNTIPLDPNVPGSAVGHANQTADSNFTTVAANLRQQVTINISAEIYNQASSLFGGGPGTTNVLTETFDASALVGNIITVGNLVTTSNAGGLDISASTFTYTPYLLVGSGGPDVSQDQLITGTPYQEIFTNFPLSSQVLTGLFLAIGADDYTGTENTYTHTLFDRLGPAARQGAASVNLNLPSPPAPALTAFDLTSVNIMTARQPLSSVTAQQTRLTNAYNTYEAFKPQVTSLPTSGTLTPAQQEIMQQAVNLGQYLTIAESELVTMGYDYTADLIAQQNQTEYFSRVYPNSPRITIASSSYNGGNTQEMLDVLKNDLQVIDGVGQNRSTPFNEEIARGMMESLTESSILNQATGQTTAVGIGEVFGALGDPNLLTVIGAGNYQNPSDPQALSSTNLTADAQTLIFDDVQAGNVVMTPSQMVTVNGVTTVGWWEVNPNTGHTISHFVNGGHQGLLEYIGVLADSQFDTEKMIEYIGRTEGFAVAGIQFTADVLDGVAAGNLKVTKNLLANPPAPAGIPPPEEDPPIKKFFDFMTEQLLGFGGLIDIEGSALQPAIEAAEGVKEFTGQLKAYLTGFASGYYDAIKAFTAYLPADPESLDFISTPLGLSQTPPTPGTTPGVQVGAISVDPTFTMPINGNELPLVFDLPITNTGPSTDTFNIQIVDPSNFRIYTTVSSLTLQGGQSGMVNVCVVPYDSTGSTLPPIGQAQNYSVTVTSATNSAVTATAAPSFNAPPIPVLEVSTDPATVNTTPGGTVSVNLNLAALGNVAPGAVGITSTVPTGITLNGLTSPVSVPLNSTVSVPLSITAAANLASASYPITFFFAYTAPGGTQQFNTVMLSVAVTQAGTCALSASATATQVGKTTLVADLGGLSQDMDAALAAPSSPAFQSRVVADMNLIIGQELTATYFQSIVPNLTTLTNAVASASAAGLPGALSNLNGAICSIGTLLNQANTTSTTLRLIPSGTLDDTSFAVGPNSTAQWNIAITNNSPVLHVYQLTATGVTNGVTVQFSQPTITLPPYGAPYNSSNSALLTLTTGATFNTPFSFNVVATPQDAPEFPVSAPGTLLARPESVNIDQLTATPPYTNAGTPINISVRIFSVVNEATQGTLQLTLRDPNGNNVCCGLSANYSLTPTTSVQTVSLPSLATTNFINGVYTYSVVASGNTPQVATATGTFLIGSPLSGTLTANPSVVGPGSSTVQATLGITRDTTQNPIAALVGSANVSGLPRDMTLFQNGAQQLAYVCSDSVVNIVDVTNTANPTVLGTFAGNILTTETDSPGDPNNGVVPGFQAMSCTTYTNAGKNYFLISYDRFDGNITASPIYTHFATYSLANPTAPAIVGSPVSILRPDSTGLYIAGTTALMSQSTTFYNPYSNFINGFSGDIWAADLTNVATTGVAFLNDIYSCGTFSNNACSNVTNVPTYTGTVGSCTQTGTTPVANLQYYGGPYKINPGTAVNSTTTYFTSSNSYGGNVEDPSCPQIVGQILVVDTTTPSSPSIVTSVPDPAMAFITGIAIQPGTKTAIVVGDSVGFYDINSGYYGTLVISAFDITNPRSPVLLSSVTTQLQDTAGAFIVPLGSNTFAVGNTTLNKKAELVLVDASNPNSLRYVPYDASFVANPFIAQNGYFFALSATPASTVNAISVFQLSQVTGPQLSASLQIPTTGNALLVPGSFSVAPTTTTPATGYTTYTWTQPTVNTITFNMNLSGVNPGDVTTLVNSGQLNFTLPSLGSGTYPLGSLADLTQHILSISPASQAVSYGAQTANYTATIASPLNSQQTFNLSAIAPPGWTGVVPANVAVPANGSQTFNVAITPPANAQYGNYTFNVAAGTGGISDTVPAILSVSNSSANLGTNADTNITAFTASISPSQVTVGQNDNSAPYTITFTNTGNINAAFQANASPNIPNGLSINTYQPTYYAQLSPNISGSIMGTIFASRGIAPGLYPITIPVQGGDTIQNLSLTVKVSSAGVGGYISPGSGPTSSNFTLILTNTGQQQDTFNLSVVGPLATAASVTPTVTLASLAVNQTIPITFNKPGFVLSSSTPLEIKAVSQNDPNAQALITATVTQQSSKSVSAAFTPPGAGVSSTPGSATLLFAATNTGTVTDTYTASITNTTGSVTATLGNANSPFLVSPLGTANLPLNATLTSGTSGTVTVTVTSTSTQSITAKATATIGVGLNSCDLTQAGSVGLLDVQTVINEALGAQKPLNDINNDGVVNVVDVQTCIDQAIGLNTGPQSVAQPRSSVRPAAKSAGAPAILAGAALSYTITDLGTLGGSSTTAYGVNNLGQVVGTSETAQAASHAFLWEAGQMTDLSLPEGGKARSSSAYGINDAGQIAGNYLYPDRDTAGFFYAGGVASMLSQVPHGKVMAINNVGQIAGDLARSNGAPSQAFLWNAGTVIELGSLGGSGAQARAINDSGQVAGFANLEDNSAIHAFLYSGAGLSDLGTLGGRNSMAYAINRTGQVAGASQTSGNGAQHAFLYSAGVMTDLGTLGGAESEAQGINASGWVIGWSRTAGGQQHAFLWSSGRMVDLNSFAAPAPGVWLEEATAVNDVGQIVANASNGHAYLIALPLQLP
jgi:probable HAF family extracellular repeat protein